LLERRACLNVDIVLEERLIPRRVHHIKKMEHGCGYAKDLSSKQWINHLRRHKIPKEIAVEASSFIKELGWDRSLISRQTTPSHGLAPQPGSR